MHEAKTSPLNCFLTLTYDKDHVPPGGSLVYKGPLGFQSFVKRMRRRLKVRIRYFVCGEYGEKNGRPHYHACVFGVDFLDKTLWKKTAAGSLIYRSKVLESLWPFGHSSVGDLTFESAAYCARYVMGKLSGSAVAIVRGSRVDLRTGELLPIEPEFCRMSLKPGIGARWLEKYVDDVYAFDRVVVNGRETKPPRYYDKLISQKHPFAWHDIRLDREDRALLHPEESTARRLEVREAVTMARLAKFRRGEM